MNIDTKKWLPLAQAAKYAKTARQTIVNWHLSGRLTAITPWRKDRLYSVDDIDKILREKKN
jgi:diketogulonate reductase-like aldo/keto reductase